MAISFDHGFQHCVVLLDKVGVELSSPSQQVMDVLVLDPFSGPRRSSELLCRLLPLLRPNGRVLFVGGDDLVVDHAEGEASLVDLVDKADVGGGDVVVRVG